MTRSVYYSYDARGLQTAARFDSASGADAVASIYDGFGRLTSSTTSMNGSSMAFGYLYDADGNRTRITHLDSNFFTYEYDGLDRPVAVRENGGTSVVTMSWGAQGRRAGEVRGAVATSYGYDAMSRLSSLGDDLAGSGYDVVTSLAYNPASQITTKARSNNSYAFGAYTSANRSYVVNGLNQYAAVGSNSYGYDSNGNLTSDGGIAYTYDAENRLVASSTGANLIYDPLGRLSQAYSPSTGITRFYYDGDQLTMELNGSGAIVRRYVHGPGVDDPLLWYEASGLTLRRSLQVDHQGSIVSVADAGGNALWINSYDEYGVPASGNQYRFQYTGQAWIPELGMYYYKARIYAPMLGRFMQTDPIGYDDQVNLYAYVGNDPVNRADPSGMAATGSIIEGVTPSFLGCSGNCSIFSSSILPTEAAVDPTGKKGPAPSDAKPGPGHNGPPIDEDQVGKGIFKGLIGFFLGRIGGVVTGLTIPTNGPVNDTHHIPEFPNNAAQLKHIFRGEEGHFPSDTPQARSMIEDAIKNPDKAWIDKYGNGNYRKTNTDGTQTWVQERNGIIQNAGLNKTPR